MEHVDVNWNRSDHILRSRGLVFHLRSLGCLDTCHSRHDGRIVSLFAYIASSLGRIHEQILPR